MVNVLLRFRHPQAGSSDIHIVLTKPHRRSKAARNAGQTAVVTILDKSRSLKFEENLRRIRFESAL
jgi:hypothetical protein